MYIVGMYGSISKHEAWHKRHMHLVAVETNLENVILTSFFPFCTKWVISVQSTLLELFQKEQN